MPTDRNHRNDIDDITGRRQINSPRDPQSGLPTAQVWDDTDIVHVIDAGEADVAGDTDVQFGDVIMDFPTQTPPTQLIDTSTGEVVWARGGQDIEVENDETHARFAGDEVKGWRDATGHFDGVAAVELGDTGTQDVGHVIAVDHLMASSGGTVPGKVHGVVQKAIDRDGHELDGNVNMLNNKNPELNRFDVETAAFDDIDLAHVLGEDSIYSNNMGGGLLGVADDATSAQPVGVEVEGLDDLNL